LNILKNSNDYLSPDLELDRKFNFKISSHLADEKTDYNLNLTRGSREKIVIDKEEEFRRQYSFSPRIDEKSQKMIKEKEYVCYIP
jgi:hypothetical protein